MNIISPVLGPGAYAVKATTMQAPVDARTGARAAKANVSSTIDFSRVTPRQLQAYVSDMVRSNRMTATDGSAISSSIPHEWYAKRPDVPVDFTANMKGKLDAVRGQNSKPLAAFYAGLMERMKMMEAQSVPISVVA